MRFEGVWDMRYIRADCNYMGDAAKSYLARERIVKTPTTANCRFTPSPFFADYLPPPLARDPFSLRPLRLL